MSSTSRALALAASAAMLPGACTGTAVRGSESLRHETAVVIGAGSVGSDYYVYAAGHPNGIVQDAIRRCGGRLVAMSGPPVEALLASHPEYTRAVIPAGLYPGHRVDVPTFGARATLVTTAAAPDDVVYEVARAVLERFDDFMRRHPAFAPLDPRQIVRAANRAPLHPGAERCYRERGWLP